jgi:hypothetical protein
MSTSSSSMVLLALVLVCSVDLIGSFSPVATPRSFLSARDSRAIHTTATTVTATVTTRLQATVVPAALQLLQFQEPQTNVTVVLVGAMHYNPASIQLAESTILYLGKQDKLGSVVIESCDIRWNKTAELYDEKPFLKTLLTNEMRTACDLALSFNRPVVLGDQRINITSSALKSSLQQTFKDLVSPPTGWKRFVDEVGGAWEDTALQGGDGYLSPFAVLDPRLLAVLPISLVKYPLAFLIRSPLPTSIVLTIFAALLIGEDSNAVQESSMSITNNYPISDWIGSLSFAALETAVFARLFLKPLLAVRNEVLAKSILDQCKLYAQGTQAKKSTGWFDNFLPKKNASPMSTTSNAATDIIYVPGSPVATTVSMSNQEDRVVVAVLGMAHCNGIMKLLKEQRV